MSSPTTSPTSVSCCMCDYVMTQEDFDLGKGRIMYSEGFAIDKGEYRCGCCDIRCSDPDGESTEMFCCGIEVDTCDYCNSFDYNCDGCDSCCWCGGSGDYHQGCDCPE